MSVWTTQSTDFAQTPAADGEVNFSLGQPSRALLPLRLIRDAAAEHLSHEADPLVLQYGSARGFPAFRRALAELLTAEQGHEVSSDELFVTNGNSGGLAFVLSVLCPRGRLVFVEDTTYFLAGGIFKDAGMRIRGVACDGGGMRLDALAAAIAEDGVPDVVYVIPTFHNPTGRTMPPSRRAALADAAAAHGFLLVSDEPYNMLWWAGSRPPPSLSAYDRGRGSVVSLGTVSKILGPGLRVGWVHAAPQVTDRLAASAVIRSGGCANPVGTGIVHSVISTGRMLPHLASIRGALRRRSEALAAALRQHLPGITFTQPDGGYFIWCRLPPGCGMTAAQLLRACEPRKVRFFPGAVSSSVQSHDDCFRLSFAFYEPEELAEGVRRLAEVLRVPARM